MSIRTYIAGNVVRIGKDSRYYGMSHSNPSDVNGVVTDIDEPSHDDDHFISVKWDNGDDNVYRPEDLKLVRRANA